MSWFRIHTDVVDNPKIQSLPAVLFKFWVNLLCVSQKVSGFLPESAEISFRCRVPEKQVNEWIAELKKRKLIDQNSENQLFMHDWDEHQFVSDNSTERVKKHRAKRKGNVSGTAPEQSRTEYRAEQSAERSAQTGNCPDGAPRFTAPTHTEVEAQEIAARMATLHPKPTNRTQIESALVSAIDRGFVPKAIEASHADWCGSADWTEDAGKWCPGLAKWMTDDGFTKKPRKPAAKSEAPQYFNLAEAQERDRKRKNGTS